MGGPPPGRAISPRVSKPCRSYIARLRSLVASRYANTCPLSEAGSGESGRLAGLSAPTASVGSMDLPPMRSSPATRSHGPATASAWPGPGARGRHQLDTAEAGAGNVQRGIASGDAHRCLPGDSTRPDLRRTGNDRRCDRLARLPPELPTRQPRPSRNLVPCTGVAHPPSGGIRASPSEGPHSCIAPVSRAFVATSTRSTASATRRSRRGSRTSPRPSARRRAFQAHPTP